MDNQDIDIKNLQFTSEDIGSFFSKSYTEYKWKFDLDGVKRTITLNHSKLLGTRIIYLGKQQICKYRKYTYNFKYSFSIDIHNISIIQSDGTYILKIDDIPFNKLLNEQKLRRFDIIKETFLEKDKGRKNKKRKVGEIRKFLTFNRGSSSIPISRRTEDQRNIYRTNISRSSFNDMSENSNIYNENNIDTSTNKNSSINEESSNRKEIILNPERFDEYYYDDELSEDLSNMAIDGGDSDKDEDENDDDQTVQESFRPPDYDIFNNGNQMDNDSDDFEENEEDENNINNINNDNNNDNINNIDKKKEYENEKQEENKDKDNEINNDIEQNKSNKHKNKNKKGLKKIKIKKEENKYNIINNKEIEDNENNINNDNNINNINNNDHIDLLGEEIYNSSRDKDLYNINNIDNNLNINNILSQKQKYSDYKSSNPSNPFEDDSINTN